MSIIFSAGTRGGLLPVISKGEERGGIALRKSYIENLAVDDHRLVVSAGNFMFPNILGLLDKGQTVLRCFDAAGYDVALAGNGDFHLGVDVLRDRAGQANFSIIATNILRTGTKFSLKEFQRYLEIEMKMNKMVSVPDKGSSFPLMPVSIVQRAGRTVAVIGFACPQRYIQSVNSCSEVHVVDPFSIIDDVVATLKEAQVDAVLLLTTVDAPKATKLGAVQGVDCVVTAIGASAPREVKVLTHSTISDGSRVMYIPEGGTWLGHCTLKDKKSFSEPSRVRVDRAREPDIEMERLVEALDADLIERYSNHITTFTKSEAKRFTDICGEIAREATDCEISLIMKGTFQSTIVEGPFRSIDLWRALPFGGTLSRTYMKGSYLKSFLDSKGHLFCLAGCEKRGSRWVVNHRYLQPDITYSVALNTFIANGGYRLVEKGDDKCKAVVEVKGEFRDIVEKSLQSTEFPALSDFRHLSKRPVVHSKLALAAAYTRINANDEAPNYSSAAVPGLSTDSSTDISADVAGEWKRQDRTSDLLTTFRTKYRELDGERTIDELILRAHYEYVSKNLDGSRPFFDTELNTTLTSRSLGGDDRPYKLKLSLGYSFDISKYAKFLVGLSHLRLLGSLEGDDTFGSDLTLQYNRSYPARGITVSSRLNSYASYQGTLVKQLKWESTASVKVIGNLSFRLNYDILLYEDDSIGGRARSSQLFIGVAYQMFTRHF